VGSTSKKARFVRLALKSSCMGPSIELGRDLGADLRQEKNLRDAGSSSPVVLDPAGISPDF